MHYFSIALFLVSEIFWYLFQRISKSRARHNEFMNKMRKMRVPCTGLFLFCSVEAGMFQGTFWSTTQKG